MNEKFIIEFDFDAVDLPIDKLKKVIMEIFSIDSIPCTMNYFYEKDESSSNSIYMTIDNIYKEDIKYYHTIVFSFSKKYGSDYDSIKAELTRSIDNIKDFLDEIDNSRHVLEYLFDDFFEKHIKKTNDTIKSIIDYFNTMNQRISDLESKKNKNTEIYGIKMIR